MATREYTIVGPGGKEITIIGPDNATAEQLRAAAARAFGGAAAKPESGGLKSGVQNFAAGAVRGAGSIGATLLAPVDAAARAVGIENEYIGRTDRRKAMDAALQGMGADTDSLAFGAGKLGAEIAGTAGAGGVVANAATRIPGAAVAAPNLINAIRTAGMTGAPGANVAVNALMRAAGGAAAGGASAGLVNPADAGLGAGIGAVLPGALQVAGKAGGAIGGALRPKINNAPLAQKALTQYGIPLGPADVSGSGMTKALRSVLNDAPLTGGIGQRQGEAVQQGFNKAVGETFGAGQPSMTPQVLDAAKKRMGAEFDRIWNGNVLAVDGQMVQKLSDLQNLAAKLPRNEGDSLAREIDDLLGKVGQDAAGNPIIPGDVANKFQSYLRRRAEGSAGLKNELSDLRMAIIGAFNRGVSPADAAALTMNRAQYKAFKTVEPLLNSAEAGVAGRAAGDVPAGLLPQAVNKSYGSNIAGSPFEDLSQIGSQFVADRVARTGGSNRALIQNSAIGSALGLGAFANPLAAAAVIPVALVAQKAMGSPQLAKAMMNASASGPNALQRLLTNPQFQQAALRASPVAITADR